MPSPTDRPGTDSVAIGRAVAHAAQQLRGARTVEETLELIVSSAAEAMPGFEHVGVSTVREGESPVTRVASSDLVRELDTVQYALGEGPCMTSLAGAEVVVAPHLRHDQRWPTYVPEAVRRGLRSQLGVRLHLADRGTVGGLNLYSLTNDEVSEEDLVTAGFFATHASLALGHVGELATLQAAVEHRQLIGQALGILMERYGLNAEAAHAFLWRASSHGNTKVRDLAARLVEAADAAGGQRPA